MSYNSITSRKYIPLELSKRVRVKISLDRFPIDVYKSGDLISGNVYLETKDVLSVQILQIEILGRCIVLAPGSIEESRTKTWTKERKALNKKCLQFQGAGCVINTLDGPVYSEILDNRLKINSFKGFGSLTPTFQTVNEEIYCSNVINLIEVNPPGSCELILSGSHCYPFNFELPKSCPCSFVGSRGSIEYHLKLCLTTSNGNTIFCHKGFKVIREMDLNNQMVIPGTLSCPPISRNYVSSFDNFTANGVLTPLLNLARKQTRSPTSLLDDLENIQEEYLINDEENDNAEYKNSCDNNILDLADHNDNNNIVNDDNDELNLKDSLLDSIYVNDPTRLIRTKCLSSNKSSYSCSEQTMDSQETWIKNMKNSRDDNSLVRSKLSKSNSYPHTYVKENKRNNSFNKTFNSKNKQNIRNKPTLVVQRSSDNPYLLTSSWVARSVGLNYSSYPRTCLGAQTGYPISCRLTVSGRQLIPGNRVTACLTLLVEDPFALIVTPSLKMNTDDLSWCAKFNSTLKSDHSKLWSPLARAFVSYFLEDKIRAKLTESHKHENEVWWTDIVKQPYRIFLVLRQVITYYDWNHHVIAQEERDVYSGEMTKRSNHENYLLRIVLEHVFHIPPLPPTGLEGCSSIDISYSLGVVYFKLKRVKHLWIPNKWKLINDNFDSKTPQNMELIYMHDPYGKQTREFKSGKTQIMKFKQIEKLQSQNTDYHMKTYRDLINPIPIIIGTCKLPTNSKQTLNLYNYMETQMSAGVLGSTFVMQWPNSYEIGSLPPLYPCTSDNDTNIYHSGSGCNNYPVDLLNNSHYYHHNYNHNNQSNRLINESNNNLTLVTEKQIAFNRNKSNSLRKSFHSNQSKNNEFI